MKLKISLLILLLSVFALHKLDRHHILFHSCFASGHHTNFDNKGSYFATNKHNTFFKKFIQGGHHSHSDVTIVYEKINEEREKKTEFYESIYFISAFLQTFFTFSNTQFLEYFSFAHFEPCSKIYLLFSVFRI